MDQYYESQELCKYIKWKRVTWDEDADYKSFSKKILDNDDMFKRIPAFSFMSIHVVKDPSTNEFVTLPEASTNLDAGMLTNWVLKERDPEPVELYKVEEVAERKSPFNVDWSSGEVKILDTASAQEILTFLLTTAPRLQAVQLKMEEDQKNIVENVEYVRVRVGATLKFNEFDTSFWDDPKRKSNPNYVNPQHVEMFYKEFLRTSFLYRMYFKGQHIRIVPPGRTYFVDFEKNEIQIPANVGQYNWLQAHTSFEPLENWFNGIRRFWWFWFCLGMILVGDVEIL
ncbi:hypothetical protein AGDE_04739 [Angomonas deanei]|nr:hypothetical protein AGDE_04739 [Angomonas deanei]|eukprot:EPY39189.1 hypothetical protein AGDE_04739 [Angomonas deanei]